MNKHCHAQGETKLLFLFTCPLPIAVFKQSNRYGLVGGGMSLRVGLSFSLLLAVTFRSGGSSLLQYYACLPTAMLTAVMIMD